MQIYLPIAQVSLNIFVLLGLGCAVGFLSGMFGGHQSARTVHFFASLVLVLFLLVHVLMVIKSGFKRQMRAMTLGERNENQPTDHPA